MNVKISICYGVVSIQIFNSITFANVFIYSWPSIGIAQEEVNVKISICYGVISIQIFNSITFANVFIYRCYG